MPRPAKLKERPSDALAPQHERFAQVVAGGAFAVDAYRQTVAEPGTGYASCAAAAYMLMAVPEIAERIRQLRTNFARVLEEKLGVKQETIGRYLVEILTSPAGSIDADHPLCQEVVKTRQTHGHGEKAEEWETEKIKIPSKMEAAKILCAMAGWNAPEESKVTVTTHEAVELAISRHFGKATETAQDGTDTKDAV